MRAEQYKHQESVDLKGSDLDISDRKRQCGERIRARYMELYRISEGYGATKAAQAGLATLLEFESESAVKSWFLGKSFPEIPMLIRLSTLLDCDPGYLLGTQERPRQEYTDVAKTTGLSENSVERLKRWNTEAFGFIAKTIDALLSYRDTVEQADDPIYVIHSFLRQSNRPIYIAPTTGRIADAPWSNVQEYQSDDIQTLRIGHLLRDVKRSLMGKQE